MPWVIYIRQDIEESQFGVENNYQLVNNLSYLFRNHSTRSKEYRKRGDATLEDLPGS
ncbi:MAG TPA: hypothetical protein VFY40_16190 [Blastocatellia bacterium]|nr:hypothetical protein [Blastocatellia bacterium]